MNEGIGSLAAVDAPERQLEEKLSGASENAVREFCRRIPNIPVERYQDVLLGMGYLYEAFDLMFAVVSESVQATQDHSDYVTRYVTMQNVLRPYASEYGIEPGRPLSRTHRELYANLYASVSGGARYPARYPEADRQDPWLACGRRWAEIMIDRLRRQDLDVMERARYNLGYHWAIEALSVAEFDLLVEGWAAVDVSAPYFRAHCAVEEEHAGCAITAVTTFASVDDPLVVQGARDHESDLSGFYADCAMLATH